MSNTGNFSLGQIVCGYEYVYKYIYEKIDNMYVIYTLYTFFCYTSINIYQTWEIGSYYFKNMWQIVFAKNHNGNISDPTCSSRTFLLSH